MQININLKQFPVVNQRGLQCTGWPNYEIIGQRSGRSVHKVVDLVSVHAFIQRSAQSMQRSVRKLATVGAEISETAITKYVKAEKTCSQYKCESDKCSQTTSARAVGLLYACRSRFICGISAKLFEQKYPTVDECVSSHAVSAQTWTRHALINRRSTRPGGAVLDRRLPRRRS